MFTLGFRFKPWTSARSIADGPAIWNYINEAAQENGIDKHIRTGQKVIAADWSDADNRWTVTVETDGEEKQITASFLSVCSGYYNYDEGYTPDLHRFGGLQGPDHPSAALAGGSGLCRQEDRRDRLRGHRRHPDPVAGQRRRGPCHHAAALAHLHRLTAAGGSGGQAGQQVSAEERGALGQPVEAIAYATAQYQLARKFPAVFKKALREMATRRLPADFDYEKHFSPRYNPWDERVCLAPNGDLFKAIRSGKAGVVTDTIDRFTETGIKLTSGEELAADIIITATGLNMQLFGGAKALRNGQPIDLTKSMTYKGLMLSGVPNMAITFGYTNASWTLKADLVSEFICRVLNFMDDNGFDRVEPQHPGAAVDEEPFMDFTPRATSGGPWTACPSRVRKRRGGSSRTTSSTFGPSGTARSTRSRCTSPSTVRP